MKRLAVLAIAGGCAATTPARVVAPPVDVDGMHAAAIGDALAAAIEAGDLAATVDVACRAYGELAGMECAPDLALTALAPDDVMSRIDADRAQLNIQPMPAVGAGFAYWDNWSRVLTGGAWQPRALFSDDADARRVAATLVASVVVHELGHHAAHGADCEGATKPLNELRADELATPILGSLAAHSRAFDRLHARMRWVGEQMIEARERAATTGADAAVPRTGDVRAWVASQSQLPEDPGAYAVLHLARERRLLGELPRPRAAATLLCTAARDLRRGQRGFYSAGAEVVTLARYPLEDADLAYALDRDGHVYATQLVDRAVRIDQRDAPDRAPIVVAAPDDQMFAAIALAAASPTRFAIDDSARIDVITLDPAGSSGSGSAAGSASGAMSPGPRPTSAIALGRETGAHEPFAFDAGGVLVVAHAVDDTHLAFGAGAAIARRTEPHAWAQATIALPALRADGSLVFWDPEVRAIRAVQAGALVTLVGGGARYGDGPVMDVALAGVVAIAELRDGRIAFAEVEHRPATALVVREIVPRDVPPAPTR